MIFIWQLSSSDDVMTLGRIDGEKDQTEFPSDFQTTLVVDCDNV